MMTSSNGNKHLPRYWPGEFPTQRAVNSPHKGRWRGASMFSLICAWINDWVNNREAGYLGRRRTHYDVTVMSTQHDGLAWNEHDEDIMTWASCQIRKIAGAHAPGMSGTFSPSPQVCDPDMHHGTCVTHVPWCMPGSLTSGFLWNRRRGKTFPAFPAHAQPANLHIW